MDNIEFWKMNGSGNDFVLIDNRDGRIAEEAMGRLAERACRRRESVGADGAVFIVASETYDFAWRFFNADGGEAEMCGNGGRCVSRFAYLKGIAGPRMTFGTLAGPVTAEVDGRRVKVLMPRPAGWIRDIDVAPVKGWLSVDYMNTGVPHVVVRVDNIEEHPVREQGRMLRYHERFSPEGTNADFIRVTGDHSVELRTYERGVEGETLACGTGAIASALTASARGLVDSPVRVLTRGGEELIIHFESDGDSPGAFREVWLEGNTSIVYTARLNPEAL